MLWLIELEQSMRLDETRNIQKSFEPKESVTRVKMGGISPRRRSVHTFNLVKFYIGVVQAYVFMFFYNQENQNAKACASC